MAYTPVPTVATGDIWTAANHNTYIRDNFAAGVPGMFTSKGDIAVATASQTATRLAAGPDGAILTTDASQASGLLWLGGGLHLINEVVLASPAAAITFNNISQIFRHLVLELIGRTDSAESAALMKLRMNADSGNNYYGQKTKDNGSTVYTEGQSGDGLTPLNPEGTTDLANSAGFLHLIIPYYRNTTWYKNTIYQGAFTSTGAGANGQTLITGMGVWKGTAAISRLDLLAYSYDLTTPKNWVAGSIATLYGVR